MSELTQRDKVYTLIGVLLAMFLGAIDQTIVATALPRIVEDLDGLNRYAWVITAYLVASTVLVPVYGKLADMYSRKTIELVAVGVFLLGSFLCGLAGEFGALPLLGDGMNQLIVFRAIQGLGGAGLMGMAFIIIADLFPPAERGKYQGLVGGVFGIASVLGPLLGGFLTDYGGGLIPGVEGWRWVFYVNVPFGALALWFIIKRMPPLLPSGQKGRLDYLAAMLLVVALVPLVLALQLDKNAYPWGSPVTLGLMALAVVAIVAFVLRSLRSRNPILDLGLFGNKVFTTANIAGFFLGAAFMSTIAFLPLFMVNVLGVSATGAGLSMVPLTVGLVLGSVISGQLVSRFGHYRLWMLAGGAILFLGILLLSRMTPSIGYWQVTFYMVITGLGVGPSMPLYTLAVQNAVDSRKLGQATSASQFFRQIGGALGTAVLGTVLATTLVSSFAQNAPSLPGVDGLAAAGPAEGGMGSSPGRTISEGVQRMLDEQFQAIADAIRVADDAELERVLTDAPLPAEARAGIRAAFLSTPSNERARNELLLLLRDSFDRRAAEIATQAERAAARAFTDAITLVYSYVLFIVVAGWLTTLLIPELPLGRSMGRARPAPASD